MAEPIIVVISNRNVNPENSDHRLFGEEQNANGWNKIRVATAAFLDDGTWNLDLIDEDSGPSPLPSKRLFEEIRKKVMSGKNSNRFVFFIHGNNQTFVKNLNKSRKLANIHNVNVIAFSWPSKPDLDSAKSRFKQAKKNAVLTAPALEVALNTMHGYLASCSHYIEFNLLVHSLGNLVIKSYTEGFSPTAGMPIFRRVVLHQGSPPNKNHYTWVDQIDVARRVYYTINKKDKILGYAEAIDPDTMGKTRKRLQAEETTYIDFTGGEDVKNKHQLFGIPKGAVFDVFQNILIGLDPELETHFNFESKDNAWTVKDPVVLITSADIRDEMLGNANPDYDPNYDDPEDKTIDGAYPGLLN